MCLTLSQVWDMHCTYTLVWLWSKALMTCKAWSQALSQGCMNADDLTDIFTLFLLFCLSCFIFLTHIRHKGGFCSFRENWMFRQNSKKTHFTVNQSINRMNTSSQVLLLLRIAIFHFTKAGFTLQVLMPNFILLPIAVFCLHLLLKVAHACCIYTCLNFAQAWNSLHA